MPEQWLEQCGECEKWFDPDLRSDDCPHEQLPDEGIEDCWSEEDDREIFESKMTGDN